MAKTLCIVKKDALALVGVPTHFNDINGVEYIGFNAGRLYGKLQLSHLFANWKQGNKFYPLANAQLSTSMLSSSIYVTLIKIQIIVSCNNIIAIFYALVYTEAMEHFQEHKDKIDANWHELGKNRMKRALDAYSYQPIYILQKA